MLTHLQRPWCWGRLRAGGEGDDRRWDGWTASPTQWTWVWVNSGSWWWTGRPGVLQFMGSQRVRHDWATEHIFIYKIYEILTCRCWAVHWISVFHSVGLNSSWKMTAYQGLNFLVSFAVRASHTMMFRYFYIHRSCCHTASLFFK